jgi:hypothetical protein
VARLVGASCGSQSLAWQNGHLHRL